VYVKEFGREGEEDKEGRYRVSLLECRREIEVDKERR